jgi:hypothetical protein
VTKESRLTFLCNNLRKYYHGIPSVSSQAPLQPWREVEENRQFVQSLSLTHTCALSLPDLLDGGGQTNVVGLELVPTPADNEDGEEVEPVGSLADKGDAPRREVVGDAGPVNVVRPIVSSIFPNQAILLETHVCVQDEHGNETSINQRQCGTGGEGNDGQGDERDRDSPGCC